MSANTNSNPVSELNLSRLLPWPNFADGVDFSFEGCSAAQVPAGDQRPSNGFMQRASNGWRRVEHASVRLSRLPGMAIERMHNLPGSGIARLADQGDEVYEHLHAISQKSEGQYHVHDPMSTMPRLTPYELADRVGVVRGGAILIMGTFTVLFFLNMCWEALCTAGRAVTLDVGPAARNAVLASLHGIAALLTVLGCAVMVHTALDEHMSMRLVRGKQSLRHRQDGTDRVFQNRRIPLERSRVPVAALESLEAFRAHWQNLDGAAQRNLANTLQGRVKKYT